jgi:hypothetical protein
VLSRDHRPARAEGEMTDAKGGTGEAMMSDDDDVLARVHEPAI